MNVRACVIVISLAALSASGCGGAPTAKVKGKVTCQGKAVTGSILFSPFGEGKDNTGTAVTAPLNNDGSYEIVLKTIGKHRVVVSPDDVVYPAKPGEEHRCDLSAQEKEVTAGDNVIVVELPGRVR